MRRRRVYHPKDTEKPQEKGDLGGLKPDGKDSKADSVNLWQHRNRTKRCDRK